MDCAIVTGGGRGIGRAISLSLADAGMAVVVNYSTSGEAAEKLAYEIRNRGGEAIAIGADVSKFEEANALVKAASGKYGNVFALINNAGITKDGLIMRMSEVDFNDVIDTNLRGAFNCIRFVSTLMIRQHRGRIVNISSVAGLIGNAGQSNYSASKAGLIGLTKSVARELAPRGITCNAVAPGLVETEMTQKLDDSHREKLLAQVPLRRMGSTAEIGNIVAFLCSDTASYITGQTLAVDGGMTMC